MTDHSAKTRVVVVGGGFAGVNCARALAKHSERVDVTLLDRNDYHQFQPLLYQVATSMLAPGDISPGLMMPTCGTYSAPATPHITAEITQMVSL